MTGMPKPDAAMKTLLENNEIFADFFNAYAFQGKQVLKAEELEPADSAYAEAMKNVKGIEKIGKYRDKVRRTALGAQFVILAAEDQDKIHYAEPVKVLLYDSLSYAAECRSLGRIQDHREWTADEYLSRIGKGTFLTPVFTLVIYTGEKPWTVHVPCMI